MNTEIDGYKDNTKVKVTFSDSDLDSITDNPESFNKVVGSDDSSSSILHTRQLSALRETSSKYLKK